VEPLTHGKLHNARPYQGKPLINDLQEIRRNTGTYSHWDFIPCSHWPVGALYFQSIQHFPTRIDEKLAWFLYHYRRYLPRRYAVLLDLDSVATTGWLVLLPGLDDHRPV